MYTPNGMSGESEGRILAGKRDFKPQMKLGDRASV